MKKTSIFFFLFFLFANILSAQSVFPLKPSPSSFIPSANAAGLGIYGNVNISPFTGLPSIGINVFSLKQGDISVNASLNYFGGGVKPETHPGWVGQNWSLNVGGVITRKQNGGVDEAALSNLPDDASADYYYHHDVLNDGATAGDWYLTSLAKFMSSTTNGTSIIPVDMLPDEFFFTLPNGVSGSLFLNHEGVWKVKSKNAGNLIVTADVNPSPAILANCNKSSSYITLKRLIYKFIITDQDGTKYTFGNTLDAIEFIRGPRSSPAGQSYNNEDVVANSWYLTNITSAKSDVVNFVYERKENQVIQNVTYSKVTNITLFTGYSNHTSSINYGSKMITPCYLKEINSASFKVSFSISPSTELACNYRTSALNGYDFNDINWTGVDIDNDIRDGLELLRNDPPKWYQLDGIQILDKANIIKQNFNFVYNDNVNERLFLKMFRRQSTGADHSFLNYTFDYNATALPAYCSTQCDQWGYYNGITLPNDPSTLTYNQLLIDLAADATLMQAGTLTKITYPTGGYTTFDYQPNNYGSYLQKTSTAVNLAAGSGIGGGLRIWKITDNDSNGGQYTKQYDYTNAGSSTGILAGRKQLYVQTSLGSPTVWGTADFLSNDSFSDLDYTEGRDVVYSQVKETLQDGSYNIYKYSNSDNTNYRDFAPFYIFTDGLYVNLTYPSSSGTFSSSQSYPILTYMSNELERGQLLSKQIYSASNKLIYQETNQYRDDPERYNQYIRSWQNGGPYITGGGLGYAQERYFQAIKIFNYFPYLKNTTETIWDVNGLNPVATTKQFVYDANNRLLTQQTVTTSKADASNNQEQLKTVYHYPVNMTGTADPNGVYQSMSQINQISPVVEKITYRNATQIGLERANYAAPYPGIYVPVSTETQHNIALSPELREAFTYTATGNMKSVAKNLGSPTGILWGYNNQYAVAEAGNASPNDVLYESFEEGAGNGTTNDAKTGILSFTGAYTKSLNALDPGTYTLSYWKKVGNAWVWVINNAIPVTGTTYTITIPNSQIDDVRFYPSNAQLTTYTYNSLIGMTSSTNAKGEVTYYEYDGFGRLSNIRDKDGNIMKHLEYHYLPTTTIKPIPTK